MMDVHPKFIIEGKDIIFGKVTFHRHLANDIENVIGGGWYTYNPYSRVIVIDGNSTSDQFGKVSLEDIKEAIKEGTVYSKGRYSDIKKRFNIGYFNGTETISLWDRQSD